MGGLGLRALAFGILLCASTPAPIRADSGAGLGVQGAMAELTAEPGQHVTHTMRISLGSAAAGPLRVSVQASGLGETLDGATVALIPEDDSSPFSARELITALEPDAFTLQPGTSQVVNATFAVPRELRSGIRYADLYISSDNATAASGNVGTRVAVHVPVLLTIANSRFTERASITSLDVDAPAANRPVVVTTVVENTGDHHFRAEDQVTIHRRDGSTLTGASVPLTGSSLLPEARHAYRASIGALAAGRYEVTTRIVSTSGEVLAERASRFRVGNPQEESGGGESGGGGSNRHQPVPTAVLPPEPENRNPVSLPEIVAATVPLEVPSTPGKTERISRAMPQAGEAITPPPPVSPSGSQAQPATEDDLPAETAAPAVRPAPLGESPSSRAATSASGAVARPGQGPESAPIAAIPPSTPPATRVALATPAAVPRVATPEVAGAVSSGTFGPITHGAGLSVSWPTLGGLLAGAVSSGLALYTFLPRRKRERG